MKFISWNVNGIRAILNKGFLNFVQEHNPDILCLQETKAHPSQVNIEMAGYHPFWNSAVKKGYSGTAIFTKQKPISEEYKIGIDEHDQEGRIVALEFDKFFLVNVYTPNSGEELARLGYRVEWDKQFLEYVNRLNKQKPVIFCGDLNVAHTEIDLANPKTNRKNAGFTDEERMGFNNIIKAGYIDTFREFNKEGGNYTWWTYRFGARARNVGWRIDYFCIAPELRAQLQSAAIHPHVLGSDHCPVEIVL